MTFCHFPKNVNIKLSTFFMLIDLSLASFEAEYLHLGVENFDNFFAFVYKAINMYCFSIKLQINIFHFLFTNFLLISPCDLAVLKYPLISIHNVNVRFQRSNIVSNFSCMFLNPNIFSNLNFDCSDLLDMRKLQEQVEKAFCYQKFFWPFTVIHCNNLFIMNKLF